MNELVSPTVDPIFRVTARPAKRLTPPCRIQLQYNYGVKSYQTYIIYREYFELFPQNGLRFLRTYGRSKLHR